MARAPKSALLVVDMINAFDFEGARALLRQARPIGANIRALKARARARRSPTPDYLAFREAWEEARAASPGV